jgi:hypothetical protein
MVAWKSPRGAFPSFLVYESLFKFLREYFSSLFKKYPIYRILARRGEGGWTGISLQADYKNIDLLI